MISIISTMEPIAHDTQFVKVFEHSKSLLQGDCKLMHALVPEHLIIYKISSPNMTSQGARTRWSDFSFLLKMPHHFLWIYKTLCTQFSLQETLTKSQTLCIFAMLQINCQYYPSKLHPCGLICLSFCQLFLQWCPGDESIIWNPLNCKLKLLM